MALTVLVEDWRPDTEHTVTVDGNNEIKSVEISYDGGLVTVFVNGVEISLKHPNGEPHIISNDFSITINKV